MRSGHKKWVQYWGIVFFSMVDYISQEKWLFLHDFPTIAFILFLSTIATALPEDTTLKKAKTIKKSKHYKKNNF